MCKTKDDFSFFIFTVNYSTFLKQNKQNDHYINGFITCAEEKNYNTKDRRRVAQSIAIYILQEVE